MFDNIKRRFFENQMKVYLGTEDALNEQIIEPLKAGGINTYNNSDAEKIAVCMTCIKVLGDTISKLPVNVYQTTSNGNEIDREDYRYELLHYSPDGIITSNQFFGALEYQRNLRGNSFARIHRDKMSGQALSLEFIPSNLISGYKKVRGQLFYMLLEEKNDKKVEIPIVSTDMLHFKMITKNSIWGINPLEAQRLNLSTLWKAKNTVDSYYENNAFTPKVLKSLIPDAQFQAPFAEAMKSWKKNGAQVGPMNAGTVGILPPFTEIQELGLNPIDAFFIEGSKFDAAQICSFYGVPPEMGAGIYENSKYSNVEQNSLNFKVNTISNIARMYRQELEFKLLTTQERANGKSIEFVLQALMDTDVATRSAYYKTMFDLGVITQNQIALLEGFPTFPEGDKHYMSSQTTALEDRVAPEEPTETQTDTNVDEEDI